MLDLYACRFPTRTALADELTRLESLPPS